MIKVVKKNSTGLKGEIIIPADKSISHRAIMLASIAQGKSIITNFSSGADCQSTLNIFKKLGIEANFINQKTVEIFGSKLTPAAPNNIYPCENSGTTMRLTAGILAGQNFDSILTGDESLSKRPMKRIIEPLTQMGADISSMDGKAPLSIRGTRLSGINYVSKLSSAQVKSAVLLAGINPRTQGKTIYTEPFLSRNHTERMINYLDGDIAHIENKTVVYPTELIAKDIEIVGDISSAAFFIVAGLIIEGSDILIKNVGINPTRTGILDIVKRMNGNIEIHNIREISGEPCADIRVQYSEDLVGCKIDSSDIPRLIDELPVIAVLASQAEGETTIRNAEDLRNKETDRITCLVSELQKIGVEIREKYDGFIVEGKTKLKGNAELKTYQDHRLAMSFYTAGLICENEIAIDGFEWTEISFPEFEELMDKINTISKNIF